MPLASEHIFVAHLSYLLPATCSDGHDVVHRFVLAPNVSTPLNDALGSWALLKEARAAKVASMANPPSPGRGSDAGYHLSNRGGYQSFPDVFDARALVAEGDSDEARGRQHARLLHIIASRAIDELNGRTKPGKLQSATAWLNVNRPRCFNVLHTHPQKRWSAVYYVASGEPAPTRRETAAPSSAAVRTSGCAEDAVAGHLVFRCGSTLRRPSDDESKAAAAAAHSPAHDSHHTYFAVPPIPGTLCLFPGSMPHCVMSAADTGTGTGAMDPSTSSRISIAINFRDAAPDSEEWRRTSQDGTHVLSTQAWRASSGELRQEGYAGAAAVSA